MLERERTAEPFQASTGSPWSHSPESKEAGACSTATVSPTPPAPLPEKGVCWSALLLWGALNPHGIGGVQVAVVGAHYVMGFLVYALTSALGILAWLPGW